MQISFLPHSDERLLEKFARVQRNKTIAYLKKQFSLPSDDCEDIFQEAFITLFNNIQEGKLKELTSSISTYFMAICKNKTLELLRSRGNFVSSSFEVNVSGSITFLDEQVDKILMLESDDEILQERKEALVRNIVRDLPSPCDELLWGYYRDGFSMKDLAEKLNYASENTVKVTKHRCCEKFRNRFNECLKSLF
ncbi:MAG: sigma-70 family RNA polymerase sigma factor [Parabacteroides sp.]|nr:sigma-70 family RNA polymerase sigma factor [Parabacteroides sp.]